MAPWGASQAARTSRRGRACDPSPGTPDCSAVDLSLVRRSRVAPPPTRLQQQAATSSSSSSSTSAVAVAGRCSQIAGPMRGNGAEVSTAESRDCGSRSGIKWEARRGDDPECRRATPAPLLPSALPIGDGRQAHAEGIPRCCAEAWAIERRPPGWMVTQTSEPEPGVVFDGEIAVWLPSIGRSEDPP